MICACLCNATSMIDDEVVEGCPTSDDMVVLCAARSQQASPRQGCYIRGSGMAPRTWRK